MMDNKQQQPAPADAPMIALNDHCRYRILQPNGIFLVEIDTNNRATVDVWVEFTAEIRRNWDRPDPISVVVDTTALEFAFTPYMLRRGVAVMTINGHIPSNIAWVIRDNLVGNIIRGLVGRGLGRAVYYVTYDLEDGIAWVDARASVQVEGGGV